MSEAFVVNTEYGKVRGTKMISALKTPYKAFFGIPYAAPPVGELRFRDPITPTPWSETLDAIEEKPGCFEMNSVLKKIIGTEDCLRLNIFTKDLRPKKLQPVMVYIFGGGYTTGCAWMRTYSPDYLFMSDVIVVTMNCRLGAFGFLSFDDKEFEIPGNAGLKDQSLAMKFVKDNIESFGGDPNNITLFGHSSGAGCVGWHCASERSKGLFNRAIVMSGSILNPWSLTPRKDWAHRLAVKIGYEGSKDEKEIFDFLKVAEAEKIVEYQQSLLGEGEEEKIQIAFAPVIEPYVTDKTFIWGKPTDMFKLSWSHDIDFMIGATNDEGLINLIEIRKDPKLLESFKIENLIPIDGLETDDPNILEFVNSSKKIYLPHFSDRDKIGLTRDERIYCNVKGDLNIWHGIQRSIIGRQSSVGKGKTYLYRFGIDSPTQNDCRIRRFGPQQRGVVHADEIYYFFKKMFGDVPAENSIEMIAIKRFVSVLTSFATSGNPNDNIINADLQNIHWEPVDTKKPPFKGFIIEEDLKFDFLVETERLKIWDRLYEVTNTSLY